MSRPRSGRLPFFGFWVQRENRHRHRVCRVEKWETRFGFSTFPGGARPGGGNVKIPPVLRDFQGAVGSVENLGLVFHASHGTGISTAPRLRYRNGGSGDCTLHCRSSRDLATFILRAHSVSLIASASRSNSTKLRPGLRYCSARSSDFSFSNGVR
jgi:hypothetical protein